MEFIRDDFSILIHTFWIRDGGVKEERRDPGKNRKAAGKKQGRSRTERKHRTRQGRAGKEKGRVRNSTWESRQGTSEDGEGPGNNMGETLKNMGGLRKTHGKGEQ